MQKEIIVGIVALILGLCESHYNDAVASKTIDTLFRGYDKRIPPSIGPNGTLDVLMSFHVLDVFNVDEEKHEFSVNMYLRHQWSDPRLKYNITSGLKTITLDADHATQLWEPDTFIINERNVLKHSVNTVQEFTKILPSGRILQSSRITVTASCRMSLGYFPFDRQLCSLEFGSYGYLDSNYNLDWVPNYEVNANDLSYSSIKFRFTGLSIRSSSIELSFGKQKRLFIDFYFSRHSIRYVQDIYFPAFFVTLLALSTLYLQLNWNRVQLSFFVMLAMVLFINGNSNWMPKVAYQTCLDAYVFISTIFVLLTLLANLVMYKVNGRHAGSETEPQTKIQLRPINSNPQETLVDQEDPFEAHSLRDPLYKPTSTSTTNGYFTFNGKSTENLLIMITGVLEKCLPMSYAAFNTIYWLVVLIGSSVYPTP